MATKVVPPDLRLVRIFTIGCLIASLFLILNVHTFMRNKTELLHLYEHISEPGFAEATVLNRTETYKISKFRTKRTILPLLFSKASTCSDELLDCHEIYDAECFHFCERAHFHTIESCLIPIYPLLKLAVAAAKTSERSKPVCLLYDSKGFMTHELVSLLSSAWAVPNLHMIPYRSNRSFVPNSCWRIAKPGHPDGTPESPNPICFSVDLSANIESSIDWCSGKCQARNISNALKRFRQDIFTTYNVSTRKDPNEVTKKHFTAVLVNRQKSNSRSNRAFRNVTALEDSLWKYFSQVLVYNGESSFSVETAALFAAADVIIFYHGAGVVNGIYSHSKTAVVELFSASCPSNTNLIHFGRRMEKFGTLSPWLRVFVGTGDPHPSPDRGCKYIHNVSYTSQELQFVSATAADAAKLRGGPPLNLTSSIRRYVDYSR